MSEYAKTPVGQWHYAAKCPSCGAPTTRQRRDEPRRCRPCASAARRYPHRSKWWTEQRIKDAMLDWVFTHGRWPTSGDWSRATLDHPTQKTVADRFGSWNRGKRAAGWRPFQAGAEDPASLKKAGDH